MDVQDEVCPDCAECKPREIPLLLPAESEGVNENVNLGNQGNVRKTFRNKQTLVKPRNVHREVQVGAVCQVSVGVQTGDVMESGNERVIVGRNSEKVEWERYRLRQLGWCSCDPVRHTLLGSGSTGEALTELGVPCSFGRHYARRRDRLVEAMKRHCGSVNGRHLTGAFLYGLNQRNLPDLCVTIKPEEEKEEERAYSPDVPEYGPVQEPRGLMG